MTSSEASSASNLPLFKYQAVTYRGIKNVISFCVALLMFISMLLFCLPVNIGQIIAWFVSFVNPTLGAKINTFCAGAAFVFFTSMIELWAGVTVEVSGDDIPNYENAICIGNHVADTDFILMMNYAYRKGMLGHCKYMSKNAVRFIPFLGWGMHFLNMIFLKRNWDSDKAAIFSTFKVIKRNLWPTWLISFLEGTRITSSKLAEAQEFAKQRGLPHFEHVMVPRVKGFIAMIEGLRNSHIEYIYDFTFGYVDGVFSFRDFLGKNLRGIKLCINVKRYPIKDIPEDKKEIEKWVMALFERKEKMLQKLAQVKYTTKSFEGEPIRNEPFSLKNWIGVPFEKREALMQKQE